MKRRKKSAPSLLRAIRRAKAEDLSFLPPGMRETPAAIQEFEMLPEPAQKPLLKGEREYAEAWERVEGYTTPDGAAALRRLAAGRITLEEFEELLARSAAPVFEAAGLRVPGSRNRVEFSADNQI